ncbi:prolyl oligopeptidase family serine peptidase [Snodgrassella gandavensis]|uniref:prolyl oligopeptidase family serine peptidase n=1 Tax=Snodgrassella gandavensis TaxID=2946698 RepID=UPI003F6D3400
MMNTDPFAYLEDLNSEETQAFIQQANSAAQAEFATGAEYVAVRDDIVTVLRDEQQIPFCQEHRARMYHFYQSAEFPKGVYRVCSAASYRAGLPEWEILFSVADFDALLDDDVYLQGVAHYVQAPEHVLISLSAGGADAAYTVEFNLAEGRVVEGGFHFPLSKSIISWRDTESVWISPAWDERQLTQAGYPRQVWLMQRGQSFAEAVPVLEMPADGMMVNAWRYLDSQGAPIDLVEAASGFYHKQYYQVMADLSVKPLALPDDCELMGYLYGQLLVQLRSDWQRANRFYPAGSLVAVKLHKGELGVAEVIFQPAATQAIESIETTRRFVLVSILDNVHSRLLAWCFAENRWQEVTVPNLPAGALEITDQPWGGDVVYLAISSFLEPLTLYTLDVHLGELCVMRRQPRQFDPAGMQVQQFSAVAQDGTFIPYFHVGKNMDKDTPTIVYVYGGFGMPQLPYYLGSIGRHWLAKGYAFVLANIRGGGEFGPVWHQAARGIHKHVSIDDLLAVLHDLYSHQRASAVHTAIQGGSNGGLVVAAAFCRQPQSMGAMVCEVPLTDMLRYSYLSAGSSWMDEYGDPDDSIQNQALSRISPYHNLGDSQHYPPALITTNLHDDRVHPAHALKFYARLCALKQRVWLAAPDTGGHTGGGTQENTAAELALIMNFLYKTIVNIDSI